MRLAGGGVLAYDPAAPGHPSPFVSGERSVYRLLAVGFQTGRLTKSSADSKKLAWLLRPCRFGIRSVWAG